MRNSKCTAVAERPGHLSGRGAQLIFGQTGHRTAAARMFDYFSEIKNSGLCLGIVVPEIKLFKQIKRRRVLSAPPAGGREATSYGFDFIQTGPWQSAEFLKFNQRFLFKGDSENAERR